MPGLERRDSGSMALLDGLVLSERMICCTSRAEHTEPSQSEANPACQCHGRAAELINPATNTTASSPSSQWNPPDVLNCRVEQGLKKRDMMTQALEPGNDIIAMGHPHHAAKSIYWALVCSLPTRQRVRTHRAIR
jgi:hypothetical protein